MLSDLFRSEHETFDIALELAKTDDDRSTIEGLRQQLVAYAEAREASVARLNANKLAR